MLSEQLTIINKLGLHARATAKLVTLVNQFKSDATIEKDGKSADAKSIMGVMMLAAAQGSQVLLTISGDDEKECLKAVTELINNRFGESE
jgi:phosphocarrier protein HPr